MSQNYSLAFPFKFQILDQLIFLLQKSWTEALTNSWKWNDEDIDQNTMDQMMKQREDFDQNQEVRMMNIRFTHMLHTYIIHTISSFF